MAIANGAVSAKVRWSRSLLGFVYGYLQVFFQLLESEVTVCHRRRELLVELLRLVVRLLCVPPGAIASLSALQ